MGFLITQRFCLSLFLLLSLSNASLAENRRAPKHPGAAPRISALRDFTVETVEFASGADGGISASLPLVGAHRRLRLEPISLRSASFQVLIPNPDGSLRPHAAESPRTFRGEIEGNPGARVAATMRAGKLSASVALDDGTLWHVQPLGDVSTVAADPDDYLVYRDDDVIRESGGCDAGGERNLRALELDRAAPMNGVAGASGGWKVADIAFDTDVEFFFLNGNSVANTVADIEDVMNGVAMIYEDELNITYEITTIIVRTTEPDPYSATLAADLLNQFRSTWNANFQEIHRDITHLMTGKALNNGVLGTANTDVMCDVCGSGDAFGLSRSRFSSVMGERVFLTAHEIGHGWGASHCNEEADCGIMCSMLMGCDGDPMRFGATSGATILAGADDAACLATLADPLPFPFCETFESGLDPARWTYNQSTTLSMASNNPPSRRNALLLNGCCAGCPAQSAPDDIRTNYILLGEVPEGTLSYHTQHKGNGGTAGSQLVIDYLNNAGRWIEFNRVTSDGTTQTAYTQWTHALPADSLHDGFRLRFRLDGGPTHPDWFIDDITITSVQPDSPVLFVRADAPPGGTGTSWASALNDLQDALAVADCSLGLVDEIWVAEGTYRPDRDTADRSDSFRLLNGIAIYGGFRGVELVRTERDPSSRETVLSGELGNPVSTSDNSFHIVTASGTNSTAVLDGFTITRGNADGAFPDDRGGGLLCTACNAAIRNCTWRDLRARQGGAMFITSGSPLIDNCLFMDNNASFAHGGAVAIDLGSSVRVERSRFINNFAATTGGAVDVTDSSLSVGNSLFAHNLADEGAAIYNLLASVTLNHSTLTNNGAFDSGGGIMNVSGITTVRHGIFWNNIDEGGTGESAQLSGDPSAIDYCLVQGLTGSLGGTGNLSADPAFANILGQDNIAGTIDDDFRLTPGSPAINAGDPSFIPAAGAVDLDGHPRVLAGTVDLGVYEFGIGDFDGSGNVDTSDLTGLPQCMTGPNGPPYVAGCEVFDFDGDADVDLRDYRAFESAASDGF